MEGKDGEKENILLGNLFHCHVLPPGIPHVVDWWSSPLYITAKQRFLPHRLWSISTSCYLRSSLSWSTARKKIDRSLVRFLQQDDQISHWFSRDRNNYWSIYRTRKQYVPMSIEYSIACRLSSASSSSLTNSKETKTNQRLNPSWYAAIQLRKNE